MRETEITPEECAESLRQYNAWRRGSDGSQPDPVQLGKALDAAIAHLEAMGWQPIETAPKNGTRILLYRPLAEKTHDETIDIKRGVPRDNTCWEETIPTGMDSTNYTDGACKATHWMPLPPAPKGKS